MHYSATVPLGTEINIDSYAYYDHLAIAAGWDGITYPYYFVSLPMNPMILCNLTR